MAGTKPLRRVRVDDIAVTALQDHAEQSDKIEILNAQLVTGTYASGGTSPGFTLFRHSLGRAYRGAFICGTTAPLGAVVPAFVVLASSTAAEAGFDTKKFVAVVIDTAPVDSHDITLWVF